MKKLISVITLITGVLIVFSQTAYAELVTWEATTYGGSIFFERPYSQANDYYPITAEISPFDFSDFSYERLINIQSIRFYGELRTDRARIDKFWDANYWHLSTLSLDDIDTGIQISSFNGNYISFIGNSNLILSELQEDGMLSLGMYSELDIYTDGYLIFPNTVIQRLEIVAELAPVPVPSTVILFGIGLLGIVRMGRRK